MKFGRLIWGLIILFIGLILLGINFGWWDNSVWNSILDLWPLLLVLFGIGIIFRDSQVVPIVLLVLIILFSFLYTANYKGLRDKIGKNETVTTQSQDFSASIENDAKSAKFNIDLGAANIVVSPTHETDKLYQGSFSDGNKLDIKNSSIGNQTSIKFSEDISNFRFFHNQTKRDLNLKLTKEIPLELYINSGASKLDLNLSDLKLTKLEINAGASNGTIEIGNKIDKVLAKVDTGASKFTIIVPKEYSLSVRSDSALVNDNFEEVGLKKSGKIYKSDNFEGNSKQIELEISAGASTINIEQD